MLAVTVRGSLGMEFVACIQSQGSLAASISWQTRDGVFLADI